MGSDLFKMLPTNYLFANHNIYTELTSNNLPEHMP